MKVSFRFIAAVLAFVLLVCAFVWDQHHDSQANVRETSRRSSGATALLSRANHLAWLGNWYVAGPIYTEAEALSNKSGDSQSEAYARCGRIRSQASSASLNQTIRLLSGELHDRAVERNPNLKLWCLGIKASVEIDTDSAAAKRDWSEELALAENLGSTAWAARAEGELGVFAFLDGNTAEAVSLIGKAILSAYKSGDVASQVRLLSMLGFGFNEEKRYSEALIMFRQAIATANATTDAGFPFLAYRGEAAALAGLGQNAIAKQELKRALLVAKAQNDRVHESDLLIQNAELKIADRDLDAAKAILQTVIADAKGIVLYRTVAEAMFDLADVNRKLGQAEDAVRALKAGVRISRRLGDRYYLPRDLTALAEIKVSQRKLDEADQLFEQAEDVLDSIVINQHSFEEGTAHVGSMSPLYLEHFRLAMKMGSVDRAFEVLERIRGRIVASKLMVQERSGAESPKLEQINKEIATTQIALLEAEDTKRRSDLMEQLLANERNLAFELNESGLHRKDTLAKPVPLPKIQVALRGDELLAEYVLDEPHSYCIVVTSHVVKVLVLPDRSTIQSLTNSYLEKLRQRQSDYSLSQELYRILIEPIVTAFSQSRFIISPDGILNSLPFEALRDNAGYFVSSKVVSYTPSGTVTWILRSHHFEQSPWPLLAVGAADYAVVRALPKKYQDESVPALLVRGLAELSGSKLQDLPGSRNEVLAVAKITGQNSRVLLGQDATETNLKAQHLEDFRVIHFATHAAADPQYPDRAALVLGVAPHTTDDGLLQVREIMNLRLNADLVTLSACDTQVGASRGEAGVVNLEQAFLIAGAHAVVASLWNVEDSSTTALMVAFYEHIARHEDAALALAEAKRDILAKYGDTSPYYWAAFVIAGEGTTEIPFVN